MEKNNQERQSAEFTAKTVEDALRQATEHFGVPTYRLDYEIARDNTRSILGLVRTGEVTVRAWLREMPPRATSRREPQPDVAPRPSPMEAIAEPETEEEEFEVEEEEALEEETSEEELAEEEAYEEEALEEETFEEEEQEAEIAEEEELEAEEFAEEEAFEEQALVEEEEEQVAEGMERNPPEMEDEALEVLTTLLDQMGVLAAVEVADEGGRLEQASGEITPLVLNIVGDDLGSLIGRRGETLRDLQFVLRLILSRRLGVWPNVVLDIEGYKARRTDSLQALARRMADQVRTTGRMVVLEPMPAHERRIIHLALRNDEYVYTESTGEDERRKVQIIPKSEKG